MTEKELHRLKRHDLLQLLLAQSEEAERLRRVLADTEDQLRLMESNYERLRKRLDKKDATIHDLRDFIQDQRTKREIELENAGSIAEAALRLNGIFDAAQKAADQYLYNIQLLHEQAIQVQAGKSEEDAEESLQDEEELEDDSFLDEEDDSLLDEEDIEDEADDIDDEPEEEDFETESDLEETEE